MRAPVMAAEPKSASGRVWQSVAVLQADGASTIHSADVVSSTEALLVAPDNPVLLAAAIRVALLDRAGAQARATDARARLERDFAVGPWVASYEAVYRRVLRA